MEQCKLQYKHPRKKSAVKRIPVIIHTDNRNILIYQLIYFFCIFIGHIDTAVRTTVFVNTSPAGIMQTDSPVKRHPERYGRLITWRPIGKRLPSQHLISGFVSQKINSRRRKSASCHPSRNNRRIHYDLSILIIVQMLFCQIYFNIRISQPGKYFSSLLYFFLTLFSLPSDRSAIHSFPPSPLHPVLM
mgnify:CR=1 FL=1